MKIGRTFILTSGCLALCLAGASCATKRHVRESIAPVRNEINQTQSYVNALQQQIGQNQERIGDLDRRLATAGEKAADAIGASAKALETARRAANTVSEAARRADSAAATAQQAQRDPVTTNQRMDYAFSRLNSYRLAFGEKIYFAFSQSGLTREERSKLDLALSRLRGMKNYIVEIEGFADSSGDIYANRQLSRKRADAVVHYLVVQHSVPLRSIRELGAGADFPHADNQTPSARQQNRRVDLKIYSLDIEAPAAAVADGSQP
jgi:outer membrane protein OmpA-like peptidoglycan-associated protein